MVQNAEKLEMATHFRKRGFSYTEIAKICGVSKSTVSNWFSKKRFSKKITKANTERAARENKKRIALLNKARAAERIARYREAERSAEIEFRHYKKDTRFIAGLMLYKASGDMKHPQVLRVTSADADIHRIFLKFAHAYLGADKHQIKFWLLLNATHSEKVCTSAWNKKLRLHSEQWYKNQVVEGQNSQKILHYGVGNTIIGSTVLKRKLVRWIELASKEL